MLNSRLGLFTAALSGCNTLPEHPFSRSYGVILPSSLTRVHSLTLEFSSRLPVSVCGTGTSRLARGFSWQCEIRDSEVNLLPSQLNVYRNGICLVSHLTTWTCTTNSTLTLSFCVPPLLKRRGGGTGISTCCPSSTPIGLDLGPD